MPVMRRSPEFHQDAELGRFARNSPSARDIVLGSFWRRTGRDRLGSTGAANRSFYWRYGRPEPARIRPKSESPPNPLGRKPNNFGLAAQAHLQAFGGGLVKYPG